MALGSLISLTQNLQALSLGGTPDFDIDDWRNISRGFMTNQSLETIGLDYCHMGDEAAEVVCGALKNNRHLKSLDLDGKCFKFEFRAFSNIKCAKSVYDKAMSLALVSLCASNDATFFIFPFLNQFALQFSKNF